MDGHMDGHAVIKYSNQFLAMKLLSQWLSIYNLPPLPPQVPSPLQLPLQHSIDSVQALPRRLQPQKPPEQKSVQQSPLSKQTRFSRRQSHSPHEAGHRWAYCLHLFVPSSRGATTQAQSRTLFLPSSNVSTSTQSGTTSSQRVPIQPSLQEHVKESTPSVHDPLTQGLGAHSSILFSQLSPSNPGAQVQA